MKTDIMEYDWNVATKLANVVLTKTKHSKIIEVIETIIIFSLLPIFVAFCLFFVNTSNRAFNTVFVTVGSILLYLAFIKIANIIERKNLENMFNAEKNIGLLSMYDPYMLERKSGYYLYFYPYLNDYRTKVKFEVSKEDYETYKDTIRVKKQNPKDKQILVVVPSNTNLFDGKMEYTTSLKDITF